MRHRRKARENFRQSRTGAHVYQQGPQPEPPAGPHISHQEGNRENSHGMFLSKQDTTLHRRGRKRPLHRLLNRVWGCRGPQRASGPERKGQRGCSHLTFPFPSDQKCEAPGHQYPVPRHAGCWHQTGRVFHWRTPRHWSSQKLFPAALVSRLHKEALQ